MLKTVSPPETATGTSETSVATSVQRWQKQQQTATAEDTVQLLNTCVTEQIWRDAKEKRHWIVVYPGVALLMTSMAWFGAQYVYTSLPVGFAVAQVLFPFFLMAVLSEGQCLAGDKQFNAAKSLSLLAPDDKRTLAILLDALPMMPVRTVRSPSVAGTPISTLLPFLASALWNAGDDLALILSETRRKRLRGTVNALWNADGELSSGETDFCAAAIKALALVGDKKSAKLIRRVATGDAATDNRAFVRSLAVSALPILAERAAENESETKQFRALLHPKGGLINTPAVDAFLSGLRDGRASVLLHGYLSGIATKAKLQYLPPYVAFFTAIAVCCLPISNSERLLVLAVLSSVYGAFKIPALFADLPEAVRLFCEGGDDSNSERQRVLANSLRQMDDPHLVMLVFNAMQSGSERLRPVVARQMAKLKPGDAVYVTPRYIAYLRAIVRRNLLDEARNDADAMLVEDAIHALGVLGDREA